MQGFAGFSVLRAACRWVHRLCMAGAILSLAACAGSYTKAYRPAALSPPPLTSPMAAVARLSAAAGQHGWRDHLQVRRADGSSFDCRYRDTPDPQAVENYHAFNDSYDGALTLDCGNGTRYQLTHSRTHPDMFSSSVERGISLQAMNTIAMLWYQLSHVPADNFEAQAAAYRAAPVKPELPEAMREFKVRAESAVTEKRFLDAVEAYDRGLQIAPTWPQGHFNAALVLAELKVYGLALEEMQRYLALVPDAANARQAQDRIYDWKGKLEKPY